MQTYARSTDNAAKSNNNMAASVEDHSIQMDSLQRKVDLMNAAAQRATAPIPVQRAENPPPRPNNTGLPDNLKNGVESLSGYSLDNVRVHFNSPKPATVQALAYTQGNDIHVAPGQEHALPHEAWHVTQQMAGRVSPTTNIGGMPVNDNESLEHEADVMGEKAVQLRNSSGPRLYKRIFNPSIQCMPDKEIIQSAYNTYCRYCQCKQETPMQFETFQEEYSNQNATNEHTNPILKFLKNIFKKKEENNSPNWKQVTEGVWKRALSINHYAYKEFKEKGILSSEGPVDCPAWTMGDSLTRWLPGAVNQCNEFFFPICASGLNWPKYNGWQQDIANGTNKIVGIVVEKTLSKNFIGYHHKDSSSGAETCVKGPLTLNDIDKIYTCNLSNQWTEIEKNTNSLPECPLNDDREI